MPTPTHFIRPIALYLVALVSLSVAFSQGPVVATLGQEGAWFVQGNDTILFYQAADKSFEGTYTRANYIHPLHALDGTVLTEDFPEDHRHQRGIFWAWHQLFIGDQRIGDGWETKKIRWDVTSLTLLRGEGPSAVLVARVDWKSPVWTDPAGNELPIIRETTTIEVFPREVDHRVINIAIKLEALHDDMTIGGSEDEKGYGGFSARIRLPDSIVFTGQNGQVTPHNLPISAGPWMNVSGPLGAEGTAAGVLIVGSEMNPGHPAPWILRSKKSMQNAVYPHPGKTPVPLHREDPLILQYRLVVHDGLSDRRLAELAGR